ncbi:hypothetical protein EF912_37095, partial [Streptomyces sp. WAC07061]
PGGSATHPPGGGETHAVGGTADNMPDNSHIEPGGGHTDTPSTGGPGDSPGAGGGHGDGTAVPHQASGASGGVPDAAPGDAGPGSGADQPMDPKVVDDRIKELDGEQGGEGHAPGRHLYPNDQALIDRLGTVLRDENGDPKMYGPNSQYPGLVKSENNVDPLNGKTVDHVHGGPHRVGAFATRFESAEDMVRADRYFRDEMARTGEPAVETPIEDVLGHGAHERFTGYYRNPANLNEFKPVDFEGGTILPVYKEHDGVLHLHTMFANPARGRHP